MPTAAQLFSKKLERNDWLIIIANLVPVVGVLFFGWSAIEAFIVYALETLIMGILTILKLLTATFARGKDTWYNNGMQTQVSGFFFIFFFVMHFGIFALVQTSIFAGVTNITPPGKWATYFFFHWWEYINGDIAYMLGGFVISYLARDFFPFIFNKDYKTIPMMILMFQPYGRILVQQFTVIIGSMFLTFHFDKAFIFIFAVVKIMAEVYLNFDKLLTKTVASLKEGSGEQ